MLLENLDKANQIRKLNKPNSELTIAQLIILLAAFKSDGDKAVPTKKADLLIRLAQLETRGAVVVGEAVTLVVAKAAIGLRSADEQDENSTDGKELFQSVKSRT